MGLLIGLIVGLLIGWNIPQPEIVKTWVAKAKTALGL